MFAVRALAASLAALSLPMMQNQATVDAAVAEAYLNAQHAQALAARQRSGGISLDFSLGDGDVHRPHKVRDSLPHIASKHCDGTSAGPPGGVCIYDDAWDAESGGA